MEACLIFFCVNKIRCAHKTYISRSNHKERLTVDIFDKGFEGIRKEAPFFICCSSLWFNYSKHNYLEIQIRKPA